MKKCLEQFTEKWCPKQVQKKHYRKEKKRATKELLSTLKDPSVIVMADWLKVRGTLKGWTKLWCVLKPGLLVLYKSHKQKVGDKAVQLAPSVKKPWTCKRKLDVTGVFASCSQATG